MLFNLCRHPIKIRPLKSFRFAIRTTTTLNVQSQQPAGIAANESKQPFSGIYTDMIIDAVDHKPKMKYEHGDYSFEPTTYPYRKKLENNIKLIKYGLILPVIFFIFGCVQLHRYFRNADMLERARSRLMSDDVIHELPDDITQLQYQRVVIKGRFLFDKEIFAGPCLRYQCRHFTTASNLHIYTPFELENGKIIWVDRGVISYQKYNNPNFDYQHYEPDRYIQGFIMDNNLRGYRENVDEYFIADYGDMHIHYFPNEVQNKSDILIHPPSVYIFPGRHSKWFKFWFFLSAATLYNILRTAPKI